MWIKPLARRATCSAGIGAQEMAKPWLKEYPAGVSHGIGSLGYASRTELFEDSYEPFRDLPAFSNMATVMTHAELEEKSRHFAAYLQVRRRRGKGSRHPATRQSGPR